MFSLTIFGFRPENGSTKGTLGMKFEPERLAFGGVEINMSACVIILSHPCETTILVMATRIRSRRRL